MARGQPSGDGARGTVYCCAARATAHSRRRRARLLGPAGQRAGHQRSLFPSASGHCEDCKLRRLARACRTGARWPLLDHHVATALRKEARRVNRAAMMIRCNSIAGRNSRSVSALATLTTARQCAPTRYSVSRRRRSRCASSTNCSACAKSISFSLFSRAASAGA